VPTIYPEFLSDTPGQTEELVFLGSSSDHHVYALDLEECTLNMPAANTENTRNLETPCLRWSTDLGGSIFAAVRATAQGVDPVNNNLFVFASTTSLLDATSGALHALDINGTLLWSFPMDMPQVANLGAASEALQMGQALGVNVSSTGIRNTVAVDATNHAVLVASGHRVLVFEPLTGRLVFEFVGDVEDPFVSAPVLSPADEFVYLHSANGSLWKLAIITSSIVNEPYILKLAFKCNYYRTGPDTIEHTCATAPAIASALWVPEQQLVLATTVDGSAQVQHLVHYGVGGQRGLWVHARGVSATARVAGPYSTPAIGAPDSSILLALHAEAPSNGALLKIDTANGALIWSFSGLYLGTEHAIPFGSCESSPAVDASGDVYIASDSTHGPIPVLFALTDTGLVQWTQLLGTTNIDEVNLISPVLALSPNSVPRVYMATTDTLFLLEQGCPSDNIQDDCSGHGTCNCKTKQCTCDATPGFPSCFEGAGCSEQRCGTQGMCDPSDGTCDCYSGCVSGEKCDIPIQCGPNSYCDPGSSTGDCLCDECYTYDDDGTGVCLLNTCANAGTCSNGQCRCKSGFTQPRNDPQTCVECPFCAGGPACSVQNTCSGHGTCDNERSACNCEGGWYGIYCQTPAGNSGTSTPKPKGPSSGGIAVAVIIALVAVASISFVVYARIQYPGRAYADACPSPLQPVCRAIPSCRSMEQGCIGMCSSSKPGALAGAKPAFTASSAASPAGYGSTGSASKGAGKASYTQL
jgi:outer membrane protein assembly factor BamB